MTVSGEILERLARLEAAWGDAPARLVDHLGQARGAEAPDARRFAGPLESMAAVRQLVPAVPEAEATVRGGLEPEALPAGAAGRAGFAADVGPAGPAAAGLFPTWPALGAGGAGGLAAAGDEGGRVPELLERIAELLEGIGGKLDRAGAGGAAGPGAAGSPVWSASWTAEDLDQGESFPAAAPSVNVSNRGGGRGAGGWGFGSQPVRAPSDFLEPERRRPS